MHGCQLCVLIVGLLWIHPVNTQQEGRYKASICYDVIGRAVLSVRCPAPQNTMQILNAFSGISAGDTCSYQPWDCVTREESHLAAQCNGRHACDVAAEYPPRAQPPGRRDRPKCRNGTATYIHVAYTCYPPPDGRSVENPTHTSELSSTTISSSTMTSTTLSFTTHTTDTPLTTLQPWQPPRPTHTPPIATYRPPGANISAVLDMEQNDNSTQETSTDIYGDSPHIISIWENDFTLVVIVAGSAIGLVIVAALVWTLVKKARGDDDTRQPQPSSSETPAPCNRPASRQPRRNQRYISSPHQDQAQRQAGVPHAVAVPAHMNHRQLRQLALYDRQHRR